MRDPDLVFRAQHAAASLEGAWNRWRVAHALTGDPMPTVSSYVGYSHSEPWGQPRVVFGLAAEDAEQLAAVLERHDCPSPALAAVAAQPAAREVVAEGGDGFPPLPVPPQGQATEQRGDGNAGYDEPLYRQAAAAMQEAVSARQTADPTSTADDQAVVLSDAGDADVAPVAGNSGERAEPAQAPTVSPESEQTAVAEQADEAPGQVAPPGAGTRPGLDVDGVADGGPAADDPVSADDSPSPDETGSRAAMPMGSLARAASTAKAEAEARIKATRTDDPEGRPVGRAASAKRVGGPAAMPLIGATDVLEPLPEPETLAKERAPAKVASSRASVAARSEGSAQGTTRRSKATRSYSMPRIARTKKPDTVQDA